jgi:hypothetical protein
VPRLKAQGNGSLLGRVERQALDPFAEGEAVVEGVEELKLVDGDGLAHCQSNPSSSGSPGVRHRPCVPLTDYYTPSAGSHTFLIRSYNASAATISYVAGAGGTGTTNGPGHLRITRIPT